MAVKHLLILGGTAEALQEIAGEHTLTLGLESSWMTPSDDALF